MPKLCTLAASPFDAALHDAFGKVHGLNCYDTYGPEFMTHDLAHYLGAEFEGEWISRTSAEAEAAHAALSPGRRARSARGATSRAAERRPARDAARVDSRERPDPPEDQAQRRRPRLGRRARRGVDRVATAAQRRAASRPGTTRSTSTSVPERRLPARFPRQVKEQTPAGFERVQYIEQPTARDLKAHPRNVMHEAAKHQAGGDRRIAVDLESLLLAREWATPARPSRRARADPIAPDGGRGPEVQLFLCVQDLTCPGASLIHSAGLAAHVPAVAAIEANSRQYCPRRTRSGSALSRGSSGSRTAPSTPRG